MEQEIRIIVTMTILKRRNNESILKKRNNKEAFAPELVHVNKCLDVETETN